MAAKPIVIRILGDSSGFDKTTGEVEGKLGKLGGKLGKIGLAVGAAAATGIAAAGVALFTIGSKFDEMENTLIKGTGATGDALDALMQSTKDALKQVPESGDVVASAIADVNTFFGHTGEALTDTTKGFLDFARVAGTDVGSAIGSLDAQLTQFGLGAEHADEAMGDLVRISQASGAPMDKLLGQMETFGPIFANAGFELEETTAILGQLEMAGVNMTRVGPALNKFFRDAASEGKDPQEALKGTVDAMSAASSEAEALNIATEAFGAEGAQRMTTAIRSGNFDLEDFNGLLGEGAGVVADQAAATETFGDKWNKIKNRVFVALEPVATKLFDALGKGMDKLGPIIENLVANLGPVITEIIGGIRSFVFAFKAADGDITSSGFPGFMEKVGYIASQVFGWLKTNVPPIIETIRQVFATLVQWAQENLIPLIQDKLLPMWQAAFDTAVTVVTTVVKIITDLWDRFGSQLVGRLEGALKNIVQALSGAMDIIRGVFELIKAILTGNWGEAWEAIKTILHGAWNVILGVVKGALDILKGLFEVAKGVISSAWSLLWNSVKTLLSDIWEGIKSTISSGIDTVVGWMGGIKGRISGVLDGIASAITWPFRTAFNNIAGIWNDTVGALSFSVPSWVPGIGGNGWDVPNIPTFRAMGGAAAGIVRVGEHGPETVLLPRGSHVTPNHAGGPGGSTVNVYAETNADPWAISREVAWAVRFSGR